MKDPKEVYHEILSTTDEDQRDELIKTLVDSYFDATKMHSDEVRHFVELVQQNYPTTFSSMQEAINSMSKMKYTDIIPETKSYRYRIFNLAGDLFDVGVVGATSMAEAETMIDQYVGSITNGDIASKVGSWRIDEIEITKGVSSFMVSVDSLPFNIDVM